MMPFRIGLIGREASVYVDKFPDHNCRIVSDVSEIQSSDDLIFCVAHSRLIPSYALSRPRFGIWVNHSSDLPTGRGWAPLQWSVIKGLSRVTVTVFKATAECDAGPWAFKASFAIEPQDTIATLRQKDVAISVEMFQCLIQALSDGTLALHEQVGTPSYWRRRAPPDSELDPAQPLANLWDRIRVCDNIDYPAFFRVNGRKVVLRYEVED
jgi:methionyl-tRNA formyltransferase